MGLYEELIKKQRELEEIVRKTQVSLKEVPEGTLRVGKSQGCVQYYHHLPHGSHNGKYLSKKDILLARQLAQKTYDERVLQCAQKRLSQINRVLKDYNDNEVDQWLLCEHPERQKLIKPVEPTYAQKTDAWIRKPYVGKAFKEEVPVILTNKGLRVRSKSEKILADYFDSIGLRYKYECPVYLKPYGLVYPDFTFLSGKTGKEIYWEHEGMMDNPEYARAAVRKIELYESNGIYPGERLILTFETSVSVINTNLIKEITDKYLIMKQAE